MNDGPIVVIAASAGGIQPLSQITRALEPGFPAAVMVCVDVRPDGNSVLPGILSRHSKITAHHAVDGEPIHASRI